MKTRCWFCGLVMDARFAIRMSIPNARSAYGGSCRTDLCDGCAREADYKAYINFKKIIRKRSQEYFERYGDKDYAS